MDAAGGLGDRLGPVLLQLPPTLERDVAALEETLEAFPAAVRVAIEPRHASWFTEDVRETLARHGAALCLADRLGPITPAWRTANWTYLRFHEGAGPPCPCYREADLAPWVERLAASWPDQADVYIYFNNDPGACALRDAALAARLLGGAGLHPTRAPDPAAARIG